MRTKLPLTAWGHVVLHGAALLKYRPSGFNAYTPHHLAYGMIPNVSHLKTFGFLILVPILGPKRTKMGPQRREGIFIGFDSPSIVRYLDPSTANLFKARYLDCQFREDIFPTLNDANTKYIDQPHDIKCQTDNQF